ncbi:hypothetical protein GQ53DRAFT_814557 [Thozetella sp. PMI_491]|nr:hypothetical protein GQ53DRAFT_814557 [Thozetella sp. PMI_491]
MKPRRFSILIYALIGGLPNAIPATAGSVPSNSFPRTAPVCKREDAHLSIPDVDAVTGSAQVVYTVDGGASARSICQIINHDKVSDQPCTAWSLGFAVAINTIIFLVYSKQYQGNPSEDTGTIASPPSRREGDSAVEQLTKHLEDFGFSWENVEASPIPAASEVDGKRTILDQITIRRIVDPSSPVPHDQDITRFSDGAGVIRTSISSDGASSNLQRRHPGPGFKFNWELFENPLGDPYGDLPNYDERKMMDNIAHTVTKDWARRADNDKLDEYYFVASWKTPFRKSFGVRVTSEHSGFGDNYEGPNMCQHLSTPAHDDLK